MAILGTGQSGAPIPGVSGYSGVMSAYTWITAENVLFPLANPPHSYCLAGRGGFGMPPMEVDFDEAPDVDGGLFRQVRVMPRALFLPVLILGNDRAELMARQRALSVGLFNGRGQRGSLRSQQPDGTAREIACYFRGGMTGEASGEGRGVYWATFGLEFMALDPYWTGQAISRVWTNEPSEDYFPILPMNLSSSAVIGSAVPVDNPGDVETWPVWTISGPAGPATFTRNSDGALWTWSGTLTAGQWLRVDTTPGAYPRVTDQADANRFSSLAANPNLWSLQPGVNLVNMALTGATVATEVAMTAPTRYLTE